MELGVVKNADVLRKGSIRAKGFVSVVASQAIRHLGAPSGLTVKMVEEEEAVTMCPELENHE